MLPFRKLAIYYYVKGVPDSYSVLKESKTSSQLMNQKKDDTWRKVLKLKCSLKQQGLMCDAIKIYKSFSTDFAILLSTATKISW